MQLGEGVEWSIHCCAVLALLPSGATLPAARLAEFHDVPPAYLAKHLQALAKAGIVESVAGAKGGYRLSRPPSEITVLDVVEAVEGRTAAFDCTEIRQRGPAAVDPSCYRQLCGIARTMHRAEAAWRAELRKETVASLVVGMAREADPDATAKGIQWFQEVLR
jgi:Rrf2 family protein